MLFEPNGGTVTLKPAEEIHHVGEARVKLVGGGEAPMGAEVSYAKGKNKSNQGRWYRVVQSGPGPFVDGERRETKLKTDDIVLANLSYRDHLLDTGSSRFHVYPVKWIVGQLVINDKEKMLDLFPLRDYVFTRPNEKKHLRILQRSDDSLILPAPVALDLGQRTSEADADDGEDNRLNEDKARDGVHVLFEEVFAVGAGAWIDGGWQEPRCAPGDMIAFKTLACTEFNFRGVTYHAVPACSGAMIGRVPSSEFK